MLNLLLHFVVTAYFFFSVLVLETTDHSSLSYVSYVTMQAFWLAAHLSRIVMLVWPCSKAKHEASLSARPYDAM